MLEPITVTEGKQTIKGAIEVSNGFISAEIWEATLLDEDEFGIIDMLYPNFLPLLQFQLIEAYCAKSN